MEEPKSCENVVSTKLLHVVPITARTRKANSFPSHRRVNIQSAIDTDATTTTEVENAVIKNSIQPPGTKKWQALDEDAVKRHTQLQTLSIRLENQSVAGWLAQTTAADTI